VRTVVILGAGELGGALARQLAAADITQRIVLVDDAGRVAEGKALDIAQAAPVDGYTTKVTGGGDESAVIGADVVVVADRAATGQEWQDDAGVGLIRRISHRTPAAVIMCAGAHCLDVIERGVREADISRYRLFGSGPEALRSAVVAVTALEARCAPTEVSLAVLGRPPGQVIVPWEDAAIGGRRATAVLSPPAITRLDGRLSRLWPPGPLTLASAAVRVLHAMATRARPTVCTFVAGARTDGAYARAGMLPVIVGAGGIVETLEPSLSVRDRVRLETVLQR
jgi:hypothetical protein